FDTLVKSFPSLIALGAARAGDERVRAVLAVNLYQECGEGDPSRSHHAIYRKFLEGAGLQVGDAPDADFALRWRDALRDHLLSAPPGSVLGALAAGEFLAQPALSRLYPVLQAHFPDADQEYFTHHLELEAEHVEEITGVLKLQVEADGGTKDLAQGFEVGLAAWEDYFSGLNSALAAR
ncbi:MAG TPA: iron-containing redox enzyme family protein, partial [bacterium]|nr:iron-containing redox enzyme family protein [bacterium]